MNFKKVLKEVQINGVPYEPGSYVSEDLVREFLKSTESYDGNSHERFSEETFELLVDNSSFIP